MSRSVVARWFAMVALLAMAVPVWASPMRTTIHLDKAEKVGTHMLPAGKYRVVADSSQVKFEQHSKVVAELPAHWKHEAYKDHYTAVVTDTKTGKLTEIHFGGKDQYLIFS